MKHNTKKYLIEARQIKENLLIEETIIKNRLLMIFESEHNLINFARLPKQKQREISLALYTELHRLGKNNLINEDIFSNILSKVYGKSMTSVVESLFEPFIDKLLTQLNITGGFKNFLVSFLTTNPKKLIAAFRDCRTMAELVAESIAEAIVITMQKEMNMSGLGWNIIRNVLGKVLKEQNFIKTLSDNLESYICDLFSSFMNKNKGILPNLSKKAKSVEMPIG